MKLMYDIIISIPANFILLIILASHFHETGQWTLHAFSNLNVIFNYVGYAKFKPWPRAILGALEDWISISTLFR